MTRNKVSRRVVYMHTIDGAPAEFFPGYQIAFAHNPLSRFADSLRQIRREQRESSEYRLAQGFADNDLGNGYIRVRLPK